MNVAVANQITAAFWLMSALCCCYGVFFGGRDGRVAAALVVGAVVGTQWAQDNWPDWTTTNLPVMVVDAVLLLGLLLLALRSRSFWPLWMSAAQLLAVATHCATLLSNGHSQRVYAGLEGVWAIPCLLSMAIGISLDRRARLSRHPAGT